MLSMFLYTDSVWGFYVPARRWRRYNWGASPIQLTVQRARERLLASGAATLAGLGEVRYRYSIPVERSILFAAPLLLASFVTVL